MNASNDECLTQMHEALKTWTGSPWPVGADRQKIRSQVEWSAYAGVPLEPGMRESLGRHFDVVVVIWFLALALGWSVVSIARTPTQADWSAVPQSGAAWVIPSGDPAR